MFIRIRRKQLKIRKINNRTRFKPDKPRFVLQIELLQSYRNDDGRPRNRTTYLGSIREQYINDVLKLQHFWFQINRALNLSNLTAQDQDKVRQMILEHIPQPDQFAVQQKINEIEASL